MSIKTWIQNWLDIEPIKPRYEKEELDLLVRKAILGCFSEIPNYYGWEEGSSKLEKVLRTMVNSTIETNDLKIVEKYVKGEKFIDDLVKRIKDKQL